eukprot:TRINITY_DN14608_c0_g1_i1.p2 TRINITY_DN14608_c0_g1~~TRINITY_DN14608_c0_g1_i1.p2  ORF type:complete len:103 (+),score=8.26 TRINITY_DN14608_c0_g1_i1:43-351(+)
MGSDLVAIDLAEGALVDSGSFLFLGITCATDTVRPISPSRPLFLFAEDSSTFFRPRVRKPRPYSPATCPLTFAREPKVFFDGGSSLSRFDSLTSGWFVNLTA